VEMSTAGRCADEDIFEPRPRTPPSEENSVDGPESALAIRERRGSPVRRAREEAGFASRHTAGRSSSSRRRRRPTGAFGFIKAHGSGRSIRCGFPAQRRSASTAA
jgi:hypothetical protein